MDRREVSQDEGGYADGVSEWRCFWSLPVASALGYTTSTLHVYSIGSFIAPLQQAFGWSRGQISAGLTVSAFGSAMLCIPLGRIIDRAGPRRVALPGVLFMCGAFALLGTAQGNVANWLMLWSLLAIGSTGVQAMVWTSAVATRFVASRGLAFAITMCGASISAAAFPIVSTWLIQGYGWRRAFPVMGLGWAVLVFPIILFFFRGALDQRKRQTVMIAVHMPEPTTGLTLSEGLRTPAMYKLLMAVGLFGFAVLGIVVHFVPILKELGTAPMAAARIASLIGIFSLLGRLGTGLLLDRFPGHLVGAVAFLLPMISCALLLLDGANSFARYAAAAFVGLTVGGEIDVIAYLAAKHFGLKNFASLYGTLAMALALGTAFGPLAAGAIFDHYHSYAFLLKLTPLMMAASAIALVSLGMNPAVEQRPSDSLLS